MEQDAIELCSRRYGHAEGKSGHRWGRTIGKIDFHRSTMATERPWPGSILPSDRRQANSTEDRDIRVGTVST
jgi:hypothetical protein